MEHCETKDSSQCVRVAVNIRPLVTPELLIGCTDCITVVPGEPQVQIGSHAFTFDYVFGSTGHSSSRIYDDCVAPIVDALFNGYNGTVLAYGQTGSGKTYTMGTNYNGQEHNGGIIPKVVETIFSRVHATRDSTEFLIRISFIEIFKEEVFDLLDQSPPVVSRGDGVSLAKPAGPARVPIQIRETVNGGITLAGVTEAEVRTKEEMALFLMRGALSRATGSTNMNSQSSRSHAIFTISMEQKKIAGAFHNDSGDDILCAKLHLVDLAGSERAKRTGADGMRFREGVHINKGLLALGNVISALGDEKKRKEGGHVPYRDSKLTRLLQDSLGGNSKTVMIACVSPADTNTEETLNTLKYANRARNIQNKAIINRDPMTAQMQRMRSQIEQLQTELLFLRGDSGGSFEELQILKHKISLLEASNAELRGELQERRIACEHLAQRALDAQVEKDKLIMRIESARNGKSWDEIDSTSDQDFDLVKSYVSKIQELEGELLRLQNLNGSKVVDCLELDDDALHSRDTYFTNLHELSSGSGTKDVDINGEAEDQVKELEHSSLQEKLDMELKELDKKLEQKEAEMKRVASVDPSVLKQHYEKKVHELEDEKRALQKEIEELRYNLENMSSTSDEGAQKLKEDYLQKLNVLESQVAVLKKKQDAQAQLLRQKQKSDEAAKRLHDEIHRIKTQKVQLQQKIKQESEQFRLWKASREKEVLQLKKEGRRNEYEMHKLLALNQRQKMVLQRKTEEASMATKRLKELLESRKTSSRETSAAGNSNGPGIQSLMQTIEHELEITVRVHEVRSEYERQMEERARMAKEVAELKEEAQNLRQTNLSGCPETMSPGARNSRIFALENMLATSSSTLVSMASHLSEAEERERAFSGRGRWNQVRSLAEAKNIMNFLFNLASSSRCQLRGKEVDCREKDSAIRELKGKIVNLIRQLEMQKAALLQQEKMHKLALMKHSTDNTARSGNSDLNSGEAHVYDLRPKGLQGSMVFSNAGNNSRLLVDMDTSESEHSDLDATYDDDDTEWEATEKRIARKRNSKTDGRIGALSHPIEISDSESLKTEASDERTTAVTQKTTSGLCCTCSRYSLCKTTRCECRAGGGSCGVSCNCISSKCSNREATLTKALDYLPHSELGDCNDETDRSQNLASEGAKLLQSALAEKLVDANEGNEPRRKPLSDIGNTVGKSNAPKPNQRKKWRKSVIQLVPVAAPTPQPEITEAIKKPESSDIEAEIPLQLPRAMRSAASNSNLLRERNSEQSDVSVVNKDGSGAPAPTSPPRRQRMTDEKENRGL
ncbi:kinesin-like protein KIN-4C isoform X1 [Rhododendron vialii]|uniref:kinesin-like protein KIN-4C isoform X1 n=1 Tax=Rhododendron vialii TaxID=182163 RepID=UPI00265EE3AE|nr:kinesin-like protein KIN-4C isoform X1 [Rhododendron vialii]XP_058221260.1 kinesin-like protein KIN-4C isoform X1 [Rhododendron vialii]